ncbi:MAG: hypothetical protein HYW27_00020, partial [Candidatus Aenigmarchaeota archaeon]|nr:hypothetical protein [Candidatus Aenigmarchaeota archaeon]
MKKFMSHKKILIGVAVVLSFGLFVSVASAFHAWGNYHWARTANPFTLELGDNVSSAWDGYLATTAGNWSISNVLDTVVKIGKTKPRTCKATNGRVEVCSEKYGFNGWLGIAQIWISGDHIVKGLTKVNDSYFNTGTYNTPAWRNLVMCQEVGHTLGLNHQDEAFDNANLGTCMDYTNDPETNQYPNQHDYGELEAMYAHVDSVNTVLASSVSTGTGVGNGKGASASVSQDTDFSNPSAWGQAVRQDANGKNSLYARDLGNGEK